jgi:hypothetical protein
VAVRIAYLDFSGKELSLMPADLPTFADCFADLPDPRNIDQCDHRLIDILFIAVCAVICGADGFTDMEEFGIAKEKWLRQFLALLNGIPSHDTFNRLLQRLRPKEFQACLLKWIQSVAAVSEGDIVAMVSCCSHSVARGVSITRNSCSGNLMACLRALVGGAGQVKKGFVRGKKP